MDYSKYPLNWKDISKRIRFDRAGGRCECQGECGADRCGPTRCQARHGESHPITGSKVVLTTAHMNHKPMECDDDNLKAMCQRCHLNYDMDHHHATRRANLNNGELFEADYQPMTPQQFIKWRKNLDLNQLQAAAMLGLNRRSLYEYETGKRPIPKTVTLACAAIALGVTEYPPTTETGA